jgi:hypothetical protein
MFVGEQVNPLFYNQQLFERTHILPAALGRGRNAAQDRLRDLGQGNTSTQLWSYGTIRLWAHSVPPGFSGG